MRARRKCVISLCTCGALANAARRRSTAALAVMNTPTSGETVLIHGDAWLLDHIRDEIAWCRSKDGWVLKLWQKRPALVDKHHSTPYTGQPLRTPAQRVDPEGWNHDHCEICWWTLMESEDSARNAGYTFNGKNWVCTECYEQFVAPESSPQ